MSTSEPSRAPDRPDPAARHRFLAVLLACAAGGVLVLWSTGRTWVVEAAAGSLGGARTVSHTGAALMPWLTALGWVALAGTGAMLATRRVGRIVIGSLLVASGLGVLAGVGHLRFGVPGARNTWPLLCVAGALLLLAGGWQTIRHGGAWPVMGSRYERPTGPTADQPHRSTADVDMWNALDRGEDPTIAADQGSGDGARATADGEGGGGAGEPRSRAGGTASRRPEPGRGTGRTARGG